MARIARCGVAFPLACVAHNILGETAASLAPRKQSCYKKLIQLCVFYTVCKSNPDIS